MDLSTFAGPCRYLLGTGGGLGCDVPAPWTMLSCLRWGGVNLGYMRPLCWASPSAVCPDTPASSRVGLVNARSLTNKSFILKDYFVSRELYFLFFSETWLRIFESSVFTKLLPDKCCFFNSPQMSGRGEGIATVFQSDFKCKQLLLSSSLTGFELQLFELGHSHMVLCAVV